MFRFVSIWTAVCLIMSMALPPDSWARGSRASGVSVSRSSSAIAYSRASSSVSVSRPAPTTRPSVTASRPYRPTVAPVYTPPPRVAERAVAPQAQAIAQSRTASNKTINNTTIIHNTTRNGGGYGGDYGNGGGGGYNRGPGIGSQILAGAAGAVAGNMVYDALTDRNHNSGYAQPVPVQQVPVQAAPAVAPAPIAEQPTQTASDVLQQGYPTAMVNSAPQETTTVTTPAYNDSGVGVAYTPRPPAYVPVEGTQPGSWSWVFKVLVLIGCVGALMAILIYIGNRTRKPSVQADPGVFKSVANRLRTYAPLYVKNVNLVPGLKVTLPQSVLGGEDDWSYVGDKPAGEYPVVAVGVNDVCAHLYLDPDHNEFIRVMLGSESGGRPQEAFFFSRIEECYEATGNIVRFVHGELKTYANREWELFWARPISAPDAPMTMGTETIQDADHSITESSYSDWMYRRKTNDQYDEYLFIRRRRDGTGDYYIAFAGTDYPVTLLQ